MTEPTTAAGRALLDDYVEFLRYEPEWWATLQVAVAAIEAEARQQERERIAAAVEGIEPHNCDRAILRAAVLTAIAGEDQDRG